MSWTQLAQNKVIMCYVIFNKAINFGVSQRKGNWRFNWATIIF